ncbi:MAG TPA: hypothetical protein VMT03_18745 [Polyangia bacterium]|nr:hypothetical protein [Polyangia bacterium]
MPPPDTFFFPSSGLMTPAGGWLYVANSNADLRYNDGTLVMVDTTAAAVDRDPTQKSWPACPQVDYVNPLPRTDPPTCCWDALDSNILNCDERLYIQSDATVRIGSFAAGMVWQDSGYCTPTVNGSGRMFIGVRGDTSLTWVDVNQDPSLAHPTLNCSDQPGPLAECTQKVVDTTSDLGSAVTDPNPPQIGLPDEPYALEIDQGLGLLYVGHLVGNTSVADSGGISLFKVGGAMPQFVGPFSSPFPANSAGAFGVTAINLHPSYSGGSSHEIFVSSRYLPLVTSMVPYVPGDPPLLTTFTCGGLNDLVVLPAGETLSSGLTGSEMRGVEFLDPTTSGTPQRAFALQRVPPDLVTFDITTTESGGTIPVVSSVVETCSSPTFLYKHQIGNSTRLYVSCFDTGEIYVFDVNGPSLITSLQAARGPAGMVFDPLRPVAYVLDFSHNDVAVVDLTPGSPTEDHVIQRLGFPSVSPR